jgi:hypothetical protein
LEERSDCYDQVEDADTVLTYGHGLELDGVRCISEDRGITCRRSADGTGFSISRIALSHRPWDSPLLHGPPEHLGGGRETVLPKGAHVSFLVGDYFADCLLDADSASCLVNSDATAPPGEPDCELDQALTARVAGSAKGQLVHDCRSDANGAQDRLADGAAVQVGDLRCRHSAGRLRCAHLRGGRHGFEVDRSSFTGF